MNDTLKMYGPIGSEIMNIYFVVAMCFKSQPRWRRLQTTYICGFHVVSCRQNHIPDYIEIFKEPRTNQNVRLSMRLNL